MRSFPSLFSRHTATLLVSWGLVASLSGLRRKERLLRTLEENLPRRRRRAAGEDTP